MRNLILHGHSMWPLQNLKNFKNLIWLPRKSCDAGNCRGKYQIAKGGSKVNQKWVKLISRVVIIVLVLVMLAGLVLPMLG